MMVGMTRYMVALDGSAASEYALRTAIHIMNKKNDELYLFSATEKLGGHLSSPAFFSTLADTQKSLERETDRLLKRYGKYAKDRGVQHIFALRGTAPHVGELICRAIQKKEIDVLIMGRRGLSGLKRVVLGSVSRYCVEQAPCNVLVVKEEVEQQRIEDDLEIQRQEKFESDLNRNVSRIAQEEERRRLVGEQTEADENSKKEREAEHIGVVIDEEQERKRRQEEDRIIEEREFHVENFEYEGHE